MVFVGHRGLIHLRSHSTPYLCVLSGRHLRSFQRHDLFMPRARTTIHVDVNNVFYFFFIKSRFLTLFNVLSVSYCLVAKVLFLLNLLNSEIKRISNDGLSTAAIGNSLSKSHNCQTLSCTL